MSEKRTMEEPYIDPGGKSELRVSPPIELCPDRLAVANDLHRRHSASTGDRVNSITTNLPSSRATQAVPHDVHFAVDTIKPFGHGQSKADDTQLSQLSEDSAVGSLNDPAVIPLAEHNLDSDQGYFTTSSISLSDYSSIGSSIGSFDSGAVMYRDNSRGANLHRLSFGSPIPISDNREKGLAGSRHIDSAKQRLRSFAHKMHFTDQEFEQSIAELGVDGTDCDKLLNHLVKLRESRVLPLSKGTTTNMPNPKNQSGSKPSSQQKLEGDSNGLRRIVIDGSNVAMEHGLHQIYSCRGIEIAVNYFQRRGHEHVTVFVPAHRLRTEHLQTRDQHVLNELSRKGVVVKTPSRKSSKGHIASYEDRFILKLASMESAIVVSNDQFRDLKSESSAFRETIEKRIMPFVFANDQFIPAEDPLGKRGPTLEQFLRVDPFNAGSGTCPYGRKCTYGTKCKFGHPEREETYDSALGDSWKDAPSAPGSLHSDPWSQSRPMTIEQYNMSVANTRMPPPGCLHPQYFIPRSAAHQAISNPPPHPYYLPKDHQHYHSAGNYAEYPPAAMLSIQPAVRASLHEKSYHSLPHDDIKFQSRQPGHPSITTAPDVSFSSSLPQDTISSLGTGSLDPGVSSISNTTSLEASSYPQPLSEYATSVSNHYSTQSTRLAEGRQHQYDAPIAKTDPRSKLYYHLKHLFPEKVVRRVMNKYPNETDPNKLTAMILEMQSKVKNVQC